MPGRMESCAKTIGICFTIKDVGFISCRLAVNCSRTIRNHIQESDPQWPGTSIKSRYIRHIPGKRDVAQSSTAVYTTALR
nr:hypothetical protein CFP56_68324 [Quercus suber]